MTKLTGTSGQLFSGLAETLNTRGMVKSVKGPATQATEDSSFHDLLHTVSNMAKRALSDQGQESAMKPAALQARMSQVTERNEPRDEKVDAKANEDVHEKADARSKAAKETDAPSASRPADHAPKAESQASAPLPGVVGQELAAAPVVRAQAQPLGAEQRSTAGRTERPTRGSDLPATTAATKAAEAGPRPTTAAPQSAQAAAPAPQGSAPAAKSGAAGGGFEAVAANVERAAKLSGREALPETTKVSVLQQETHLPPVQQFTATQQVANAVVAELEGNSAPAASAAPDLASAQGSTPDQPIKILTISLDPPALGNVTVRLRLSGDAVSVHLAADRRDTSQMLDQQRDSIRELMHSAGYVAEVAPVQHGSLDGFQTGSNQSQTSLHGQQQSSQPQGAPSDNSGASSGQSQSGARQTRQERNPDQETRHEQDVAPGIRRGPLYL
jgi:chemotaxis protein MotD